AWSGSTHLPGAVRDRLLADAGALSNSDIRVFALPGDPSGMKMPPPGSPAKAELQAALVAFWAGEQDAQPIADILWPDR
ncbi:MAG: hypothetical protein WD535_03345, partial [Thermaerobacterales bacterium]